MAKTKVSEFDAVASNNTDINSVNVAEGCPPSGINNAIREMASLLKKQEVGTDAMTSPDINGGTIDGATIGGSSGVTIGVSDGTVSAPSIKFTSDTNTGIYRGGTDILKFVTAGTDAITIDASQNVGIGVSPDQLLHVKSSGNTRAKIEAGNTSSFGQLYLGTENQFLIAYGSTHANEPNHIGLRNTNASGEIFFVTGGSAERMRITSGGDFQLYEDTGSTPKLFWDASEERLGIGTVSPVTALHVKGTTNSNVMIVDATGTSPNYIFDVRDDGASKLRVDGSGNFMVSTTENTLYDDNSGSGLCYRPNLSLDIARESTSASSYMLSLNNTGVDAKFINFAKDGSGVGSISVRDSALEIGSGDVHLQFNGTNDWIKPVDGSGNNKSGVDLGTSGAKFEDLYLSNSVRFDGATRDFSIQQDNYGLRVYDNDASQERFRIGASGAVTMPYQPAFLVRPTSLISNMAVGSEVTIAMATEIFDQNSDYNNATYTFTAPVTGKYRFDYAIRLQDADTASDYYLARLNTSNRNYDTIVDSDEYNSDLEYLMFSNSVLADMDAGDTAILKIYQNAGTSQTDINENNTRFSGNLVC